MNRDPDIVRADVVDQLPELGGSGQPEAAQATNPLRLVHSLLRGRYKWAIPLALILGTAGAIAGYRALPLQYRSTGLIRVQASGPYLLVETPERTISDYASFMESLVILLRSQRYTYQAMELPAWSALKRGMSAEVVQDFTDSLTISHPRGTDLIQIEFLDKDPEAARIAVNAMIRAFKEIYKENQTNTDVIDKVQQRQSTLTNELNTLRERIFKLTDQYNTIDLSRLYTAKEEEAINVDRERARIQLALDIRESHTTTQPTTAPTQLSEDVIAMVDPVTRSRRSDVRVLELRAQRLEAAMGPNNRTVADAKENLAVSRELLNQAMADYRHAVDMGLIRAPGIGSDPLPGQSLEGLLKEKARLEPKSEKLHKDLAELGKDNVDLQRWKHDVETTESELAGVTHRLQAIVMQDSVGPKYFTIDGDYPNAPEKSKKAAVAAAAGGGGIGLGLGIFILIGFLDRRLRNVGDAAMRLTNMPRILGILPALPEDLADPEQAALAGHCVHHIRALLQIHGDQFDHRVFAITSPAPGDGKTSLAISLGLSFAACESKTLLIDCDVIGGGLTSRMETIVRRKIGQVLRREGLISEAQLTEAMRVAQESRKLLGEVIVEMGYLTADDIAHALSIQSETALGLFDVLTGEPLMDCIMSAGTPGLYVLPRGAATAQRMSRLSPGALRRVLAEARRHFDTVVVDTGPILGSLDAPIAAAEADQVILTLSRGEHRPLAEKAIEQLTSIGARMAGMVFNRAPHADVTAYTSNVSNRSIGAIIVPSPPGSLVRPRLGPIAGAVVASGADVATGGAPGSNGGKNPQS